MLIFKLLAVWEEDGQAKGQLHYSVASDRVSITISTVATASVRLCLVSARLGA